MTDRKGSSQEICIEAMDTCKVFISYSRMDLDVVTGIKSMIEEECGVKCWMDLSNIDADSEEFTEEIIQGIKNCNVFLFMLSPHSQESKFAIKELRFARKREKHVVLIEIEDCLLNDLFYFNFSGSDIIKWNDLPQRKKTFRGIVRWTQLETPKDKASFLKLKSDLDCVFFLDGKERKTIIANEIWKEALTEGEYELKFVSVENDKDFVIEDSFKMPAYDKRYNVRLLPVRDKRLEQERMAEEERQKAWERTMDEVKEEAKRLEGAKADYEVFSDIKHFAQGYALVQNKETQCWHFLDQKGRLSKEGYQGAGFFSIEGFAAVKKNGLWGFIDREFNCKTGFVYSRVGCFSEGLAYFEQDVSEGAVKIRRGFLNTSFSVALDLTKNYSADGLQFDNCFKCGLFKIRSYCHAEWIDHSGRIVAKFDEMYKRFSNLSRMQVSDIINGAVGVVVHHWIDPSNCQSDEMKFLIQEQRFVNAFGNFSEDGYALNRQFDGYNMEEDYNGRVYSFRVFSNYGYVNKSGECVSGYKYSHAETFSEHFAAVSMDGKKYGFIDNQFKPICDFVYDKVGFFSEGKAAVKQDGHWGFINTTGKLIIPCEYDSVDHFSEGMAPVRRAGKWGFINPKGAIVIQCVFDEVEHFSENYCIVSINGIRFFVDKKGNVLQLVDSAY